MPITIHEYNVKNNVKVFLDTCFKNALNPSCIDLFIKNSPLSFQNAIAVSIGLSDFHKMVITVMKMSFKIHSPTKRHDRDYKYFQTKFKNNLNESLSEGICNYKSFETSFIEVLNKHASLRKKSLAVNHVPYITKTLRKAFIQRLRQNISEIKLKPTSN